MPYGVIGVRDKYPMWGFTYSNKAFTAPRYELSFLAANAKAVTYYNGSLSYRIDFEVYEAAYAFIKFGIDGHYYKRKPTILREFDYTFLTGGHVGMGFMTGVGPGLHLRMDLKFNANPGRTAYVGLGLMYQWDQLVEKESDEDKAETANSETTTQ